MNRFGLVILAIGLLCGCRDRLREKPRDAEITGRWVATKIDKEVVRFLAKTGAELRSDTKPSFELKHDGTAFTTNLPTHTDLDEAVLFDAAGKWRILPFGKGDDKEWQLLLLLPKRMIGYTFHKDRLGVYLREDFGLDSGEGIEFRRQ